MFVPCSYFRVIAVGKITRGSSFSYALGFRLGVHVEFGVAECLPKCVGLAVSMGAVGGLDFCPVLGRFRYVGVMFAVADLCPEAMLHFPRAMRVKVGGSVAS